LIVSTMAARGIWLLLLAFRPARDDRPPADMLALAVASSQRALAIIRLVLAACAVAAIFGLIGTAIRYSIVRPPAQSPVLDTSILAVIATALILYLRQEKVSLLKLQYLNRALTFDSTRETDGQ
jgi:hypothetical protein